MQYKLYENGKNDTSNILQEVLQNRGINDYQQYVNLNETAILPYRLLDNINEAVSLFMKHFGERNKIGILVDEDPDGFCSAAMMYMYIKSMDSEYPVEYILHTKAKAHGLSDDVSISDDIQLLIIPDAGTNDIQQCRELSERDINILILDHHEREDDNPYALIVNNQLSEHYSNKDLCGAGIVYRFLQALDDENWCEFADNYLDLCALANISDVMDMRSFETRYLTNIGLLNIKNKCFQSLLNAQEYSTKGKITIHNIQWYITPILNGMIRIGSQQDKELLFRAFIEQDEEFEYKKRATKDTPAIKIKENIYDRVARLCKNAKARQDKLKDKSVAQIVDMVNVLPQEDKIIMLDVSETLDESLTGVVAIKIAETFNKPCILLEKHMDGENGQIVYGGSARNVNHSPIDNLKDVINSTNILQGKGHANAFGIVNLPIENKSMALAAINDALKNVIYDSTYRVDFIMDIEDVSISLIRDLAQFDDIVAQGIDEPMLAIENITLTRDKFEVFGKNEDVISFMINNIKYIQFRCKEGNKLYDFLQNAWDENDSVTFNIVGKPSINEYNGVRTPQIIIEGVNVTSIGDSEDDEW